MWGCQCFLLSPQQEARVSEQEQRYLWALVSLSATESVQSVLLEGHPSWKFVEEVQTLLLHIKQGLAVSRARVSACTPERRGQGCGVKDECVESSGTQTGGCAGMGGLQEKELEQGGGVQSLFQALPLSVRILDSHGILCF